MTSNIWGLAHPAIHSFGKFGNLEDIVNNLDTGKANYILEEKEDSELLVVSNKILGTQEFTYNDLAKLEQKFDSSLYQDQALQQLFANLKKAYAFSNQNRLEKVGDTQIVEINLENKMYNIPLNQIAVKSSAYTENKPGESSSGDFFGQLEIDDHKTLVYMGDVSGGGEKAESIANRIEHFLQIAAKFMKNKDVALEKVMKYVNMRLNAEMSPEKLRPEDTGLEPGYASGFFAVIDKKNGTMEYNNSGHHSVFMYSENKITDLKDTSMLLGMFNTGVYQGGTQSVKMDSKTKLLAYSDGFLEYNKGEETKESIKVDGKEICSTDYLRHAFQEVAEANNVPIALYMKMNEVQKEQGLKRFDDSTLYCASITPNYLAA